MKTAKDIGGRRKVQFRFGKPTSHGKYECWNGKEYAGILYFDPDMNAFYESEGEGGVFPVTVTSWRGLAEDAEHAGRAE